MERNPYKMLDKVVNGEIDLFISYEQFEELSRVLDYPKFKFREDQKFKFKTLISEVSTFVKTPVKVDIIKDDPSDNAILECALVAGVDYVVSGDRHLLSIEKFRRIKIVRANEFLRIISNNKGD